MLTTPASSSPKGLTQAQVEERIRQGKVNDLPLRNTKSTKDIIKDNVLTLFNLFNLVIALLILWVGAYKNLTFMVVIIANVLIGIIQEIRSKRAVEKLSVISMPRAVVVRDGKQAEIPVEALVLDDMTLLVSGRQVCADSVVSQGELEVNESLLTGESDPIIKRPGDHLLSGSYVISGRAYAQVEHVGADNYATQIALEAQKHKKLHSTLMESLNKVVRFTSYFIVPLGVFLFLHARYMLHDTVSSAVVSTSAALLGMLPKGLVLLTSVSLVVGVLKLAQKKTLVQELFCIETLSRVDTLCLDKTGTITEGKMMVSACIPLEEAELPAPLEEMIGCFVQAMEDNNATFLAIREHFPARTEHAFTARIPFSSERKYSAATIVGLGTLAVGAPEILCPGCVPRLPQEAHAAMEDGARVIIAAHSPRPIEGGLPRDLVPCAVLILADPIRSDAAETLAFFREQGVQLKIISGDNPLTLSRIAQKVGFTGYESFVDASALDDAALAQAAESHHIFGRVTPKQKRLLVRALQKEGHTVAMTGDGVNDVLALKDADCSIAMASGSDAARQVSQLVLLNSSFSSLPQVVMEGRRVVNNITRTASLFLVKTIFSFLLSFLTLLIGMPYPFIPIQLTLLGVLCEGTPAFILALEPNRNRIRGDFLPQVLYRAAPTALVIVIATIAANLLRNQYGWSEVEINTLCVYLSGVAWLLQLLWTCCPLNPLRAALWLLMAGAFVVCILCFKPLLSLGTLTGTSLHVFLLLGLASLPATWLIARLLRIIPYFRRVMDEVESAS